MYVFSLVLCLWDAPNRSVRGSQKQLLSVYFFFLLYSILFLLSSLPRRRVFPLNPRSARSVCVPSAGEARVPAAVSAVPWQDWLSVSHAIAPFHSLLPVSESLLPLWLTPALPHGVSLLHSHTFKHSSKCLLCINGHVLGLLTLPFHSLPL